MAPISSRFDSGGSAFSWFPQTARDPDQSHLDLSLLTATLGLRQLTLTSFKRYAVCGLAALLLALIVACKRQRQTAANSTDVNVAIEDLEKQLKASPNSASIHYQLGAVFAAKGEWARSDNEMAVAMQLDPHDPTVFIGAAQGYRARGLSAKAIETLTRAVAIDPQNPLSHFFLGVMYERESNSDKAMAEYRETKRLIDTLSAPTSSTEIRSRIIRGTQGETWYFDQFGKDYLLDDILKPLQKKLSK